MPKKTLSNYSPEFHRSIISGENPRYNRARAAIAGEQFYYTGKPCGHGHIAKRFTSNARCIVCHEEYFRNNPDQYYKKTSGWAKANPEKRKNTVRRYDAKMRGRKKGREAIFQTKEIGALLLKQKHKCVNCKVNIAKKFHADHIMPLALGGSNDIKNIQLLCPPCNLRKWAKEPLIWARENGRLL